MRINRFAFIDSALRTMFEVVATFAEKLKIRIPIIRFVFVDVMDFEAVGAVVV